MKFHTHEYKVAHLLTEIHRRLHEIKWLSKSRLCNSRIIFYLLGSRSHMTWKGLQAVLKEYTKLNDNGKFGDFMDQLHTNVSFRRISRREVGLLGWLSLTFLQANFVGCIQALYQPWILSDVSATHGEKNNIWTSRTVRVISEFSLFDRNKNDGKNHSDHFDKATSESMNRSTCYNFTSWGPRVSSVSSVPAQGSLLQVYKIICFSCQRMQIWAHDGTRDLRETEWNINFQKQKALLMWWNSVHCTCK